MLKSKITPILLITLATACAGQAVQMPFPTPAPLPSMTSSPRPESMLTTPFLTPAPLPSVTSASQPTSIPATPTKPAPLTPPAFSVSLDPPSQTIPAGASTSFFVSVAPETASGTSIKWSVAGLPSGATLESEPYASPFHTTQIIHTTCATPPGTSTLQVKAEVAGASQSTNFTLQITDRLKDSSSGSYAGSFSKDTINLRHGGPSTLQYGPFLNLQFCDSPAPRKLRVNVQAVTSVAGTPLSEPPSFSLFRSFVWPPPHNLQTVGGGYIVNARQVAQSQGKTLEWQISGGVHVLMFHRSPFQDSQPPEARPATVSYTVQVGP